MSDQHSPLWRNFESLQPVAPGVKRYLLVNQAAFADHMAPVQGLAAFQKCPLLKQAEEACRDTATPFVLALGGALSDKGRTRALRNLCDAGCYGSALSVIDSDLSLHDLANALTARCDAQLPESYDVLLRYFDTRIVTTLIHVLSPAELEAFFSCVQSWWYSDRSGALVQAFSAGVQGSEKFAAPLRLNVEQQNAFIQAGETDAVIDVLVQNKVEPLLDMPYPERHPTVDRYLVAAGDWRLSSPRDLASYCTLALVYGEGFATQPPWDTVLAAVKRGEIPLHEAIASIESATSQSA
ncbi:MAG: DUF4123 domain-containing protein [Rhizobacter sp.]|nr:DUF4123 domain-containing protein [Rhizobacter sp.]